MLKNSLIQQVTAKWKEIVKQESDKIYFNNLVSFLGNEYSNEIVFPSRENILSALTNTPFEKVKVVILGQDPYHGDGQANGLAFSVNQWVKIPPSLKNIIKELKTDVGIPEPLHGDLSSWAKQGVLLLNNTLTVRKSDPLSHLQKGWEIFTEQLIRHLNEDKNNLVFLVWGKKAEKKLHLIDSDKHKVLTAPHPSPFSAHTGFLGCRHFSKTNEFLLKQELSPINWEII